MIEINVPRSTWTEIANGVTSYSFVLKNEYVFDRSPRVYYLQYGDIIPLNISRALIVEMDGRRGEFSTSVTFGNSSPSNLYIYCQDHNGKVVI